MRVHHRPAAAPSAGRCSGLTGHSVFHLPNSVCIVPGLCHPITAADLPCNTQDSFVRTAHNESQSSRTRPLRPSSSGASIASTGGPRSNRPRRHTRRHGQGEHAEGCGAEDAKTEGALSLVREMPPQGLMRDAQAGAARLADADVHVFEASSECERPRTTDRANREDFAGGRKFSLSGDHNRPEHTRRYAAEAEGWLRRGAAWAGP